MQQWMPEDQTYTNCGPRTEGSGIRPDDAQVHVREAIRKGKERPRWLGADEQASAAAGRTRAFQDAMSVEVWARANCSA